MAVEYGMPAYQFILYDGTNSAEILAAVNPQWGGEAFIVSEGDGSLTISSGQTVNDPITVAEGERFGIYTWQVVSSADWATKYVKA